MATLAPELKVIAPVRGWQMGREEEIAYAREHGIPVKGGTEVGAVLDRRQPLGPLVGGPVDRGARPRARGRRLPARDPARGSAGRGRGGHGRVRARGAGGAATASGWTSCALIERAGEIGARHGVGIVDHIEDRIVGPQGARHLRGAGGDDRPAPRTPSSRSWCRRSTRTSSSPGSTASGPTSCTRGCGGSRCVRTSTRTWTAVNEQVTGVDLAEALQGRGARSCAARRPTRSTTPRWRRSRESGGLFSQQASPGFIELWSLQSRMAWRVRHGDDE